MKFYQIHNICFTRRSSDHFRFITNSPLNFIIIELYTIEHLKCYSMIKRLSHESDMKNKKVSESLTHLDCVRCLAAFPCLGLSTNSVSLHRAIGRAQTGPDRIIAQTQNDEENALYKRELINLISSHYIRNAFLRYIRIVLYY